MSPGTKSGATRANEFPARPATSWTAAFQREGGPVDALLKYVSDRVPVGVVRERPGAQPEQPQLRLGYGEFLPHA